METGLVAIDFTGVATSYFATSARVKADLAEIRKMQAEVVIPGIPGGVGGSGGIAQSVESQIAPVRAASMERRKLYKEEASESIASQEAITKANNAWIEADLVAQKRFFEKSEFSYEEYLNVLKQKTAQARAAMASAAEIPFGNAIASNISEAERAGGGIVPLPLPSIAERRPIAPTIEEDLEARSGLSNWEKAYGARRIESGLRGMSMEEGLGGTIAGGANLLSGIAPFGILTGHPFVAAGIGGLAVAGFGTAETMKWGGAFQYAGARLQAGTQMSQAALQAFQKVAREQAVKAGNTPDSQAKDFLDAARALVFALNLSGPEVDQYLPQLMQMMDAVRMYAVAMGIPVVEAAKDLVSKFRITGGHAQDQNAAEEFKKVADMFATATTTGALQPEELGPAIRKSGGMAQFVGLPTPDVLAALETMGVTGDKGQVIGTALRYFLNTLSGANQQPKLLKQLAGAGLNIQDISLGRHDLPTIIETLQQHMGGMQYEDRNALLKELFGRRWEAFFTPLEQNLPTLRDIRSRIEAGGGNLERMAGTMEETTQFKEGSVAKKFHDLFVGGFEANAKEFGKFVDDVGKLLDDVRTNEPVFIKGVDALIRLIDAVVKAAALAIEIPGVAKMSLTHIGQGSGVYLDENGNPVYADQIPGARNSILQRGGMIVHRAQEYARQATGANAGAVQDTIAKQIERYNKDADIARGAKDGKTAMAAYADMEQVLQYLDKNFDYGGYTSDIDPREPAGVVHGGEFVFDAVSTRRAGVERLRALQKSLRGYWAGGPVNPYDPSQVSDPAIATGGDGVSIDSLLSLVTAIARAAPGLTAHNIASGLSFFSSVHSPADMLGKIAGDFGNAFGFFRSDNNKGRGVHQSFLQSAGQRLSNPGTYLTLASDVLSHNWSGALASTLGGHAADIGSNSIGVLNEILGALKAQKLAVPINARSEEVLGGFQYEDDQTSFE